MICRSAHSGPISFISRGARSSVSSPGPSGEITMLNGILSLSRALTSSTTSDALHMVNSSVNFLFPPLFERGLQGQGLPPQFRAGATENKVAG
jgi:hypothetical protein